MARRTKSASASASASTSAAAAAELSPLLAPLTLPAELTIYTVGELHPQWLTWLAQATECSEHGREHGEPRPTVMGRAVDEADAAGVQLLLALQRAMSQRGRPLRVQDPSPALTTACAALGLASWLRALSETPAAEVAA